MIPDQLKQMFGLNSKKDISMANNIWKMLDEMAESNPEQYKEFIQKNLKQGAQEAKQKKQEKQKPFRIKPEKGILLQFDMVLNEKYLSVSGQNTTQTLGQKLQQKLDLSGSKWQQVRKNFPLKAHILLNVCYSDRVRFPLDKQKKEIKQFNISKIKQIDVFYYSLQEPKLHKSINNSIHVLWDYCIIFNKSLFQELIREGANGKKMLMSMAISYFQQRLQTDRNPLLKMYNPEHYHKLAYYAVQKFTIQFNSEKNYFFNNSSQMQEFLLEKEIDTKRSQENQPKAASKIQQQPKPQIKFKQQPTQTLTQSLIRRSQQQQNHQKINQINNNKNNQQQNQSKIKKPLIQVLNETQNQNKLNENLPYEMKSNDQGYHIEILTIGVNSIDQLSLEISDFKVKLKINKTEQNVEIELENPINSDSAKAKLKKKAQRLIIEVPFLFKK